MKDDLFIGADVGGTKMAAALVDAQGKMRAREKRPTPEKAAPREIFETLAGLLNDILNKENLKESDISGIGIGIPGIVDASGRKILATPNINLADFPLAKEL